MGPMESEFFPALSVKILQPASRDEVLRSLVEVVGVSRGIDPERVLPEVLKREASLSSRVADEIAMPHAILDELSETLIGIGICAAGIDWDGRGAPVRLVVLFVGPEHTHLSAMATMSRRLQESGMIDALTHAHSEYEVRSLLTGGPRTSAPVAARMLTVTTTTIQHAVELAQILPEDPVVVVTANPGIQRLLGQLSRPPLAERTFLVGPGLSRSKDLLPDEADRVTLVPTDRFPEDSRSLAALTLLPLLATGVISAGSEVILVSGGRDHGGLDAVRLVDVSRELQVPEGLADSYLPAGVQLEVVIRTLHIVAEMGIQGREGKPVGTIVVIGDDPLLENFTQQMILNPFAGYPSSDRNVLDPGLSETIKELAKIDGAFVVSGDGTIRSAGTHLSGRPDPGEMEAGKGARHAAALGITAAADVLAICLSESTGTITLFHKGRRMIRR